VDVVVRLIQTAEVENEIWYRILQMITGFGQANPQLQGYAAQKLFTTMQLPHISETLKCIGAYVLSEYCEYLVEAGRDPQKILDILQKHFNQSSPKARSMLLNAFVKLGVKYATLTDQVQMLCLMSSEHYDPDVQQRGVEYNQLLGEDEAVRRKILTRNPPYS
jgi:AP-2 complex subunit alpha